MLLFLKLADNIVSSDRTNDFTYYKHNNKKYPGMYRLQGTKILLRIKLIYQSSLTSSKT